MNKKIVKNDLLDLLIIAVILWSVLSGTTFSCASDIAIASPWVDSRAYESINEAVANANGRKILKVFSPIVLKDNLTINCAIDISPGGQIIQSKKFSLRFNGPTRLSDGSLVGFSTGQITFSRDAIDAVYTEWFAPTGKSDDVAINSAIKSISSGTIKLRAKRYNISAPIDLTTSTDITLEGISSFNNATEKNSTELYLLNDANCNIINVASGSTNTNISLINLRLEGNKLNQSGSGPYAGINLAGTTQNRGTLQNIEVRNVKGYGIKNSQRETTYRDVKVYANSSHGIYSTSSADIYMYNINCGWNGGSGLYIHGGGHYVYMLNSYGNGLDGLTIVNGISNMVFGGETDVNKQCGVRLTTNSVKNYCRYNVLSGILSYDNSQSANNTYSNICFDGDGYIQDNFFSQSRFFNSEHVQKTKPKYMIADARTNAAYSGLPGYGTHFSQCIVNSNPEFWGTRWVDTSFWGYASHKDNQDVYRGYPVEGLPYYTNQASGATFTIQPFGKIYALKSIASEGTTACTLSKDFAYPGQRITIVNMGTNTLTFKSVTEKHQLGGAAITLGQYDSITFIYISDGWIRESTTRNKP